MSFGPLKCRGVTPRLAAQGSRSASGLLDVIWWLGHQGAGLNSERRGETGNRLRVGPRVVL